jgi:photosystem II stability/assembly factor-like uncharacterized protein
VSSHVRSFQRFRTSRKSLITMTALTICACLMLLMLPEAPKANTAPAGDNVWTWANLGGHVWKIMTDPLTPGLVYVQIGGSDKIMKSTDAGSTWTSIGDPSWGMINSVSLAPSASNVLYVRTWEGIFRTVDGGTSWQLVYPQRQRVTDVAVSPVDWKVAYLADSDYESSVITRTVDGGLTWHTYSLNLPSGLALQQDTGSALTIAPSAPHIMIAKPATTNASEPLYKSIDSGLTWSPLPGPYANVNSVTFDPKSSDTIYLGTYFSPGGWKSIDGGASWQPLANGLQPNGRIFVINPDNTAVVHAANATAGVLESLDGGMSWTSLNTGIQGLDVETIAIASRSPLVMYAGLSGGGVWKLTRTTIQDYGITINAGALFTNDTSVTLTLTAPPGTTEMMLSNDGGFADATWEPFASQSAWSLLSYGQYVLPRTVYAKFRTGGQISGLYQDDIILDLVPPTGSVTITNLVSGGDDSLLLHRGSVQSVVSEKNTQTVYLPLAMKNSNPGFRLVSLSLMATDDLSGVDGMLISNHADFAGAEWEAYLTVKEHWLPETGAATVYVRFRDRAGNQSETYTDSLKP